MQEPENNFLKLPCIFDYSWKIFNMLLSKDLLHPKNTSLDSDRSEHNDITYPLTFMKGDYLGSS